MDPTKLGKVLSLAASDNEAEALRAMQTAKRMLARAGLDFVDLANLVTAPEETGDSEAIDELREKLVLLRREIRQLKAENRRLRGGASVPDLKADAAKTKWWHTPNNWWRHSQVRPAPEHRDWPRRVWKHYYAMPASIWKPELVAGIGAASGVLLVAETDSGALSVSCARRARPNGERYHLSAADVVAVARLASLRMWDAYAQLERRTP